MLEDDAEPSTPHTIEQITNSVIPLVMEEKPDVLFAKLFYSFGYQGFSLSFGTFIEVSSFFLLLVGVIYVALSAIEKLTKIEFESKTRRQYSLDKTVISTFTSLLVLLFVFVLGRQSTLLSFKNYLVPYRISAAHPDQTTAILYPRNKLNELMDIMDQNFICDAPKEQDKSVEKVAIDLQLANVIDRKYRGKRSMIWVEGDFFNHIGFFTSLHFKDVHVKTEQFVSRYIFLPDISCNYPN